MNFMQYIDAISPVKATVVSGGSIIANIIVWMDALKGPSSAIAAIFGAVTAVLVFAYWCLKFYREWKNSKKKQPLTKRRRKKSLNK